MGRAQALLTTMVLLAVSRGGAQDAPTEPLSPEWRWRQALATPRIGGRLRSVAVDPRDPNRVYVGTEESSLVISDDGGVTWREIELSPVATEDRALMLAAPDLPQLGTRSPSALQVFLDPPFSLYVDRILVRGVDLVQFETQPESVRVNFVQTELAVTQDLLANVVRSHREETEPVRRIALCPGGTYPLLAASKWDLYGSMDDGLTFVRLFAQPGIQLNHVVCSASDPNDVLLATGFGLFRSRNGGLTWDQVLVGWPGSMASAVSFGTDADGGLRVYAAWGSSVFAGDPDSDEGLRFLYPDFNNSHTLPWQDIWWLTVTHSGAVWAASEDGVRVSSDYGESWSAPSRWLFDRQDIYQVEVGSSESGGEVICVLTAEWVQCTEDGSSWHPMFGGMTRRGIQQMTFAPAGEDHGSSWWLVSSGELWTTWHAPRADPSEAGRTASAWARQQLEQSLPLNEVVDGILDATRLSGREVAELVKRSKRSFWVPRIDCEFIWGDARFRRAEFVEPNPPRSIDEVTGDRDWQLWVQGTWDFGEIVLAEEELGDVQADLHQLRNQVMFVAEDSWHERVMLLRQIARGGLTPGQIDAKRTRVEALEGILETWLGHPVTRYPRDGEG